MTAPADRNHLEIAVVGMAGRFPGAPDVATFWHNLLAGRESIRFFTDDELRAAGVSPQTLDRPDYVKARGILDDVRGWDAALFRLSPREAQAMDPQHRLLAETAWRVLEEAGYAPETTRGPIGLYAGCSRSGYRESVRRDADLLRAVGGFQASLGTERDFLATRVSYLLGLEGPSLTVQTACSTSLVAIHLACQALLSGECDLALAGGVSVTLPVVRGYTFQEGGIASPDGHTRAFDARAAGTVSGDGVALVALRRLDDAVEDGDRIHAVVRGSAVNNDGGFRAGYTAPSVEGQERVIRTALDVAEVPPGAIAYVEAHGAATPLGDPTEVRALTRAYGNGHGTGAPPRSCALGSVKTNIGHLDAAAGVSGFIKTVLALEHGTIPPSLHYREPNPEIPFADGPFFIPTEAIPWPGNGATRRAGVSSFGLGGTNAHVILEAAPATAPPEPSRRPLHLLVASAHTAPALDTVTEALAGHLEQRQPDAAALADVAFTLQRGRRPLSRRRAVVAADAAEAVARLRAGRGVYTDLAPASGRSVSYLLTGLGEEYPGMGRTLAQREPVFREHLEAVCAALQPHLDDPLLDWLLADSPEDQTGDAPDGPDLRRLLGRGGADREPDPPRVATELAQPAVFAVGWALLRLWSSWGVRPRALLGYSLGEYLAALAAGVFDLDDAARLVAERSRLIASLPPGVMLAVPLAPRDLAEHLGDDLSLAAVNAPELSVVAGPEEATARLEAELAAADVPTRRLATRHAFHSRMMEPVAERFRAVVRSLSPAAPRTPYLSNVTGDWARAEDVAEPEYWVRHLCGTVRFSTGIGRLLQTSGEALVEIGPGRSLGTFARQHPDPGGRRPVLASLPPRSEAATGHRLALESLGRLWISGVAVDWHGFTEGERRSRVALPGYPFERRPHWVRAEAESPDALTFTPAPAPPTELPVESSEADSPDVTGPPSDRPGLQSTYVPARTETEEVVLGIWRDVLGVEGIGVEDSFFELGGHSLLATRLVSRFQEELRVEMPLRTLVEATTPALMAAEIERRRVEVPERSREPLPRATADPTSRHEPFPLTDVQEAYWVGRGSDLQLGNVATHYYLEQDFETLDLDRYRRAWQRLVERHDMLRAIVLPDGRQKILEQVPRFRLEVLDLRGKLPEDAEEELAAVRRRMSHQVLPADRWPLFEIRASRLPNGRVRLHRSYDFLIFDAWSFEVLGEELKRLYADPETELEPLGISFRDYVLAENALRRTDRYERSRRYWVDRLETLPGAPALPLARDPAEVGKPRFVGRAARLEAPRWSALKDRAQRLGLTPTGLLLAVFSEILGRWCESSRFTLNLTLFNRLPLHPQVESLVGDFSSLTLLEVDLDGETFETRARRLQTRLWDDLDHRYFSGVRVMRELARVRGSLNASIMPVVVTSTINLGPESAPSAPEPRRKPEGSKLDPGSHVYGISQTPQVWLDHQVTEIRGRLIFNWDAVEELFPAGLLDAMFDAYRDLLHRLADDEAAWRTASFSLLPDSQAQRRRESNDTGPGVVGLVHGPVLERCRRAPERPALLAADRTVSYGELGRGAARLAARLGPRLKADEPVALVLDKGWRQAVAALGVLATGRAYLPLDPSLPDERGRHLLAASGARRAVIADDAPAPPWLDALPRGEAPAVTTVGAADLEPGPEPVAMVIDDLDPADLAYVIYTSGSTGRPKGVMIEHRGAFNTVDDLNQRCRIGPDDRVLALSSLSFDLSVYDLFGLLAAGGAVVLPEPGTLRDPAAWARRIAGQRVTVWNSVPALLSLLVEYAEGRDDVDLTSLSRVLLSGDWIPLDLPDRIRRLAPEAQVLSLGGATEASIWSIHHPVTEVEPHWASIPYGRPLRGQRFHVLDADHRPRPDWVTGDLYIAGDGLARGYLGDPERTAASFHPDPHTGERLYRTGDLGRYRPDGIIEFQGRSDFQVKIQGYRVELGEIEAALARHPGVSTAVAVARGERMGTRRLGAYAVPAPGAAVTGDDLKNHLAGQLPGYMVPDVVRLLDELPLTANGKVAREALPELHGSSTSSGPSAERPVNEALAARLLGLVTDLLPVESASPEDNLLALGATSIEIIQLANRLHQEFGFQPDMETLFGMESIHRLVEFYDERMERESSREAVRSPEVASPEPAPAESPAFELILDPEERERFKKRRLPVRSLTGHRRAPLPEPPPEPYRRSVRRYAREPIPHADLGRWLAALKATDDGEPRYRYGSAGGLYPVQTYVLVKPGRVDGLNGGAFYYHPFENALVELDADAEVPRQAHAWINRTIHDQAAFTVVLAADPASILPLYGDIGREYCWLEAGLVSQLLEATAGAYGLGTCQIGVGGVEIEHLRATLRLTDDHLVLHLLLGGRRDPALGEAAYEPLPLGEAFEEGEI